MTFKTWYGDNDWCKLNPRRFGKGQPSQGRIRRLTSYLGRKTEVLHHVRILHGSAGDIPAKFKLLGAGSGDPATVLHVARGHMTLVRPRCLFKQLLAVLLYLNWARIQATLNYFTMVFLKGRALLATVTTITSTGFLLIGFDNGLMGGLGTFPNCQLDKQLVGFAVLILEIVNGPAFNDFFDYPSATMIGLIVAIYEGTNTNSQRLLE